MALIGHTILLMVDKMKQYVIMKKIILMAFALITLLISCEKGDEPILLDMGIHKWPNDSIPVLKDTINLYIQ